MLQRRFIGTKVEEETGGWRVLHVRNSQFILFNKYY
jgi:hypothetical protein